MTWENKEWVHAEQKWNFFFIAGDGDFCSSDEHNHLRKKDKRYK